MGNEPVNWKKISKRYRSQLISIKISKCSESSETSNNPVNIKQFEPKMGTKEQADFSGDPHWAAGIFPDVWAIRAMSFFNFLL